MSWATGLGLGLGFVMDRIFGDPQRNHPVALFGGVAARVEDRLWDDTRWAGIKAEVGLVGGAVGLGMMIQSLVKGRRPSPAVEVAATAAATWVVLGGTTLAREARAVSERLAADDLGGAREQVSRIVGRSTLELDEGEVARAVVETVAENTSDAVVAPLLWGAVAGIPGLFGYRAVNTLDAMFGYRSKRYNRFGWAAARLDDLANLIPARASAALVALVRPGSFVPILHSIHRDAKHHPSPNAGQVEAAFAAALGVSLGGTSTYHGVVEDRGRLGDGPPVGPADIEPAIRLSSAVGVAGVILAVLGAGLLGRGRA